MKNTIEILIAAVVLVAGAWFYFFAQHKAPMPASQSPQVPIADVAYACDQGKTITAAYFEGPRAPQPKPGEPPMPTGYVEVSINGAPTTTLQQTISADGARYGSADESLVFWSKGNQALIMRNNSMDRAYTNCTKR